MWGMLHDHTTVFEWKKMITWDGMGYQIFAQTDLLPTTKPKMMQNRLWSLKPLPYHFPLLPLASYLQVSCRIPFLSPWNSIISEGLSFQRAQLLWPRNWNGLCSAVHALQASGPVRHRQPSRPRGSQESQHNLGACTKNRRSRTVMESLATMALMWLPIVNCNS